MYEIFLNYTSHGIETRRVQSYQYSRNGLVVKVLLGRTVSGGEVDVVRVRVRALEVLKRVLLLVSFKKISESKFRKFSAQRKIILVIMMLVFMRQLC